MGVEEFNEKGLDALQEGRFEDAIGFFQKATKVEPLDSRLWFNLGVAYVRSERYQDASDIFHGLTIRRPGMVQAWSYAGWVEINLGQLRKASRFFIIAKILDSDLPINLLEKAQQSLKNKDTTRGIQYLKWALAASLGNEDIVQKIKEIYTDAKPLQETKQEFDYAPLIILAKDLRTFQNEPQLLTEIGFYLAEEQDVDLGIQLLEQSVKQNPKFINGWIKMGLIALRFGLLEKAENAFRKVIQLSENHKIAWAGLGATLMEQHSWKEAETVLQKAALIDNENWQVLARLSKVKMYRSGHTQGIDQKTRLTLLKEAQETIKEAIILAPEQSALYIRLAEIADKMNDRPAYVDAIKQALNLDPLDPIVQRLSALLEPDKQKEK